MACFHPLRAWRDAQGKTSLRREMKDSTQLQLPCGGCLGCRQDKARGWALRCHLELEQHRHAVFTTLTYDDAHLPPTLQRRDLQLFLKRLRKGTRGSRIRFFASGEYGEERHRPHYHALLYGISELEADRVDAAWQKGFTKTVAVTPAAIAYVAGYCSKKLGWRMAREERVWPETGEVYTWEPPFIQMSRRPGIGGHARQWPQSWRSYAVHGGHRIPVPRFLHESWKATAGPDEIARLEMEREKERLLRDTSKERREAAELIAIARQRLKGSRRRLEA